VKSNKESSLLSIEVAYGAEARQLIIPLQVNAGTTAYEAIELSKIESEFAEINIY
jgi:putative ubiquitin-RnfH superfamily antitoxin RatB of RatAB toxin-antitoxin module